MKTLESLRILSKLTETTTGKVVFVSGDTVGVATSQGLRRFSYMGTLMVGDSVIIRDGVAKKKTVGKIFYI